jgi:WD40 repeat protein
MAYKEHIYFRNVCSIRVDRLPLASTMKLPQTPGDAFPAAPIPDHQLLRLIAAGSYGQVWLAQNVMGAYRAVKIVYRNRFDNKRPYERELEGIRKFEPISRLHEGFVDVLHVGRNDEGGYFYYVMELGDDLLGGQQINPQTYAPRTLATEVTARGRVPVEECVQLGRSLATALSRLHENGLSHRDVKPANIIFVNGVPKLADIGLVTEIGEKCSLVGTAGFIPPEGPGTPQADLFSLGKVLYEISTGKDRKEFPELPDHFDEFADADDFMELNEVVVRACQTDARKRYQSAMDMQAELTALLDGKSVRRLRLLESRWAAVKKLGITGIAVIVVALTVGYFAYSGWRQAAELRQTRIGANIGYGTSVLEEGRLLSALPFFVEALRLDGGDVQREQIDRLRCSTVLAQCPKILQVWQQPGVASCASFTSDGKGVLIVQGQKGAQIWDAVSGQPTSPPLFAAEGIQSAFLCPGSRPLATACVDTNVLIWDTSTGKERLRLPHPWFVLSARFSPDGQRIVTACTDGITRIWDAASGWHLKRINAHSTNVVNYAAFSPNGNLVVTAGRDNAARIWDVATGQLIGQSLLHPHWVYHAAFSPDGNYVVTGCYDGKARVWKVRTGEQILPALPHSDAVFCVDYSPDGRFIATASLDTTVKIWDAASLQPLKHNSILPHSDRVVCVAFAPDGHRLVTSCSDGITRLWDLAADDMISRVITNSVCSSSTRFVTDSNGALRTKDISTGLEVGPPIKPGQKTERVSLNNRGDLLLVTSSSSDGRINLRIWNTLTGKSVSSPITVTNLPSGTALSEDGRHLVTYRRQLMQIWSGATGEPASSLLSNPEPIKAVQFSSDGERFLVVGSNIVQVRASSTGQELFPFLRHLTEVTDAEFSPDSRRLVTCFRDEGWTECWAQVWDAASGQPVGQPMRHRDGIWSASFSRDGLRIVTASEDYTAIVWDARTGRPISPPLHHETQVNAATFSPDGRWVVTASADGAARIWDSTTGEPLSPPFVRPRRLLSVAFLGGVQQIVARDAGTNFWIWELPRQSWPAKDLAQLAELMSGHQGSLMNRAREAAMPGQMSLSAAFVSLKAKYPSRFTTSRQEISQWHRDQARLAERNQQWAAVVFHLDHLLDLEPDNADAVEHRSMAEHNLRSKDPSPDSP